MSEPSMLQEQVELLQRERTYLVNAIRMCFLRWKDVGEGNQKPGAHHDWCLLLDILNHYSTVPVEPIEGEYNGGKD